MSWLDELKVLVENGERERAVELLMCRPRGPTGDGATHLAAAKLCEELDLPDEALFEYNMALKADNNCREACLGIAEIFADRGRYDRAVKYLKRALEIEPDDLVLMKKLGETLIEAGELEEARSFYERCHLKTGDDLFLILARELDLADEGFIESGDQPPGPVSDELALLLATRFSGREGVYARQWLSPTGETGYSPVKEPFTPAVAKLHLLGKVTAGVYQLRMDNTVCFLAFDFDIKKYHLNQALRDERRFRNLVEKTRREARKMLDLLASFDIPAVLEDSGFKGTHVWILLENPLPARFGKRFIRNALSELGSLPEEISAEGFPKQAFVPEERLGNLIKVPLGIHKKSGRFSRFLNPDGTPVENSFLFLSNCDLASPNAVIEASGRMRSSRVITAAFGNRADAGGSDFSEVDSLEEVSLDAPSARKEEEYDFEKDPQVGRLLSRCAVLSELVNRVLTFREMSNEERIVLTHTLGYLENGPSAVNYLLSRCPDVSPVHFLKSPLRGNPISCPRIRARIPHVTEKVNCNCEFDVKKTMYPTPVLHLEGEYTASPSVMEVSSMTFTRTVEEYMRLKKELNSIERALEGLEKKIFAAFEEAGVEEMQTPFGLLKIVEEGGEKRLRLVI